MKTITELRNELSNNFNLIKKGEMEVQHAEAMNNTAGKILGTVNAQMAYYKLTGKDGTIEFLENAE